MTKKFIQSLSAKFDVETKAMAERLLSAPVSKPAPKKALPADDDDDDGGKKKGKRGAKGKKSRAHDDDDDDGGGGGAMGGGSAASGVDDQKIIDLLFEEFPDLP